MTKTRRWGRATLAAAALVAAPVATVVLAADPAWAVVITVDNTGDPAVGNAANCPAVPAGTCTLRDAIAAADANGGADTVSISVGPISLTQGALIHTTTDPLTLSGNGNSVTQTTANNLLHTNGPLIVTGLVASGGNTTFDAFGPVSVAGSSITTTNGSGIVSFGGGTSITVDSSTISSSGAAVNASQDATVTAATVTSSAGVGVLGAAGNVSIDASTVAGVGAGAIAGTNAAITSSTITSSTGVAVLAGGSATITASEVDGDAGAVQAGNDAVVTRSTITSGGGIGILSSFGSVTVTDSWVTGATLAVVASNGVTALRAEIDGGPSGAVLTTNGTASITTSTVTGGGHFGVSAPDQVVIVNSTITGNGGCGALSPNGKVTLVYATVVENGSVNCGFNVSSGTLESFASVVALHGPNCSVGTTISHGHNFSDDDSCGFTDGSDINSGGNPLLGPLGDNGGPTLTRLPLPGSSLIDGVPIAACSDDGASMISPLVDQRALPRPSGAGCDIGAVEVQVSRAPAAAATLVVPRFTG